MNPLLALEENNCLFFMFIEFLIFICKTVLQKKMGNL